MNQQQNIVYPNPNGQYGNQQNPPPVGFQMQPMYNQSQPMQQPMYGNQQYGNYGAPPPPLPPGAGKGF